MTIQTQKKNQRIIQKRRKQLRSRFNKQYNNKPTQRQKQNTKTFLTLILTTYLITTTINIIHAELLKPINPSQPTLTTPQITTEANRPQELKHEINNIVKESPKTTEILSDKEITKKTVITNLDQYYTELLDTNPVFKNYITNLKAKNNNPGNLRFANQPNATEHPQTGFAIFPDLKTGFRALLFQIQLDQSRNLTLQEFITKYSPPKENNTPQLIKTASEKLNITPITSIQDINPIEIAQVIAHLENSNPIINFN